MEKLGRGLVVVNQGDGKIFLSWRWLASDPDDLAFNVYRASGGAVPVKLNPGPVTNATSYADTKASLAQKLSYTVRPVRDGMELAEGYTFTLPANAPVQPYLRVPLQLPSGYTANDASVGDLDGDGEHDLVLKSEQRPRDTASTRLTGQTILQGYKLDGGLLWTINLGRNIREGAHYTQFMVYDLDGDGVAEVACKTADQLTRDDQNRHIVFGRDELRQLPHDLTTVHVRHTHIQGHQIRLALLIQGDGLPGIVGHHDAAIPGLLQHRFHQFGAMGFVVNQKNLDSRQIKVLHHALTTPSPVICVPLSLPPSGRITNFYSALRKKGTWKRLGRQCPLEGRHGQRLAEFGIHGRRSDFLHFNLVAAGQEYHRGLGRHPFDHLGQLPAGHVRHAVIGHDQMHPLRVESFHSLGLAGDHFHLMARHPQILSGDTPHQRIVVDHQYLQPHASQAVALLLVAHLLPRLNRQSDAEGRANPDGACDVDGAPQPLDNAIHHHQPEPGSGNIVSNVDILDFKVQQIIASGKTVVVLGSEKQKIKKNGKILEQNWVQVYTVENGLITKMEEFANTAYAEKLFKK